MATKSNISAWSPASSATSAQRPQRRVHLPVVDDREAVVGGPREHRQQVDVTDHVAHVLVEEAGQRVQRRLARSPDAVAVGDQAGGAVGRRLDPAVGRAARRTAPRARPGRRRPRRAGRVEQREQRRDPGRERPRPRRSCRASSCASRPPRGPAPAARTSRGRPRPAARRTVARPQSSSSATRSENERRPPNVPRRVGPPLALRVRRPGHHAVGVVDPEPALLPGAGGERHQAAQPGRAVLAALVEGVRRDPHGVDEADARQDRCAAAER